VLTAAEQGALLQSEARFQAALKEALGSGGVPAGGSPTGDMAEYCQPGKAKLFGAGDAVEALWSRDTTMWYRAAVTSANADGTYGVKYSDGRTDVGVKARSMRHLKGFQEKAWVEAKWMGGDQWYVAQVMQVNKDGSYNLNYPDDGMLEDNVDPSLIRAAEDKVGPTHPTGGDAVCVAKKAVDGVSEIVAEAESEVDAYAAAEKGDSKKVKEDLAKLGPPMYGGEGKEGEEGSKEGEGGESGDDNKSGSHKKGGSGSHKKGGGGEEAAEEAAENGGGAAASGAAPAPAAAAGTKEEEAAEEEKHKHKKEGEDFEQGVPSKEFPHYALTGPEGGCLTEKKEGGTFMRKEANPADCEKACTKDPVCVAFETGPNNHCEMHHEPVTAAGKREGFRCFDKLKVHTTTTAMPSTSMSPEMVAMNDRIKAQRDEIVARTKELLARAKATGASPEELEKLEDMLKQDMARLDKPLPTSPAELVKEMELLSGVIQKRSESLEAQLSMERDLVSGKTKPKKPGKKDKERLAESMKEKQDKLKDALKKLEEKEAQLKAEGKMDPELQREIDRAKGVLGNALGQFGKIEAAARSENGTATIGDTIAGFGRDMDSAKTLLRGFGTNVVPHGVKWWRYRWEYSYVESSIICLLCLIAAFWQKAHDWFRARLSRQIHDSPVFLADHLPHIALATWTRYFWGEMLVLLLTLMTLWMFARTGFFIPWMRFQFWLTAQQLNMPTDPVIYVNLSRDVAMQLITSVMLFFFLTLKICYRAMQNDRDCRCLEQSRREELAEHPVASSMIGKFAESPEEFAALKKGWFEGVAYRSSSLTPRGARGGAQMVCAALDERGVLTDGNHNAFPLWFFISQRVRLGVQKTFMIDSCIWIFCFFTFLLFAFLHAMFHVAYVRISLVLATLSMSVFGFMMFSVKTMHSHSVNDDSFVVRLSPITVVAVFQFPLFFLCFCTVRLTVSVWMWTFFRNIAFSFSVLMFVFMVVFYYMVSPMVVAYLIKTSFPPHTNGTADLIREVMDDHEMAKLREELRTKAPRAYSPRSAHTSPPVTARSLIL